MEGSGSATKNNVAHPNHTEEEETSPNRNHTITGYKVITDAKRCNERNRGTHPVLKIAFENVEQKVNVFRAKQRLKQSRHYKNVYMHGSKTHTERILELNAKTLLSELPNGNQYRVTANGRIVKKQTDAGTNPTRGPPDASQSTETRTDND